MSISPEKKTEKKSSRARGDGSKSETARLELIKEALLLKRAEIAKQQATQLSELYNPDKHHLADLEEMSSDTLDTDSLCAIVDLGSSNIEQIDAALARIEEGTYGTCELCEEPIHPDRLEVLPFASLCVSCQRKKELDKEFAKTEETDS